MSCPANLTLNQQSEGDVPLDQAIYLSGIDKIIGIRGKWIYKFNATTGAKESEARWADTLINDAYITNIGSTVYISGWRGVVENYRPFPYVRPWRNVFAFDPSTMAVTGLIDVAFNDDAPYNPQFYQGFRNIVTNGTLLYGWNGGNKLYRINPANIATYTAFGVVMKDTCLMDMLVDSTNGLLWWTQNEAGAAEIWAANLNSLSSLASATPDGGPTDPNPVGLTFDPVHNKIYVVQGDSDVIKVNANEVLPPTMNNPTWSRLSILQANAQPVRIKYRASNGLIYIPTWRNDTVEILDPATDTITAVKTGFTDPYDIVFTPTKAFAVQNSGIGLLEIV